MFRSRRGLTFGVIGVIIAIGSLGTAMFAAQAVTRLEERSPALKFPTTPRARAELRRVAPGDTLVYGIAWGVAQDARGAADGYTWRVTVARSSGDPVRLTGQTGATPLDSFSVAAPPVGDSVRFRLAVWALRRGVRSLDSATLAWKYVRRDAPPPSPGTPQVDSSRIPSVDPVVPGQVGIALSRAMMTVGDTSLACNYFRTASGGLGLGATALVIRAVAPPDVVVAESEVPASASLCARQLANAGLVAPTIPPRTVTWGISTDMGGGGLGAWRTTRGTRLRGVHVRAATN